MTTEQFPLVPPECNLRDFSYMPLAFRRLFTSETWLLLNDEEKLVALRLWCESWHQVPAASLPDVDHVLAQLSGTDRRWSRMREKVLRGWVKCTDGRLYHPVVAEYARDAWAKKLENRQRTLNGRIASLRKKLDQAVTDAERSLLQGQLQALMQGHGQPVTGPKGREVKGSEGIEKQKGNAGLPPGDLELDGGNGHGNGKPSEKQMRADAVQILAFLNEKANRDYQPVAANIKLIVARLKEGATAGDVRAVIAKKVREWTGNPEMEQYLRPKTLFSSTNFANYRGELVRQ